MRYTKRISIILLFVLVTCLAGCGQNKPLKGKVTFSDDDTPLTVGAVCFTSDGFVARGPLNRDGSYVVGSVKSKDGLPPGEYKVSINGAVKPSEKIGRNGMPLETISLVDPKFTSSDDTPLRFVVDGKQRRFDFSVDRFQGKKKK